VLSDASPSILTLMKGKYVTTSDTISTLGHSWETAAVAALNHVGGSFSGGVKALNGEVFSIPPGGIDEKMSAVKGLMVGSHNRLI